MPNGTGFGRAGGAHSVRWPGWRPITWSTIVRCRATSCPSALATVADITGKYGFRHGNVFHAGDGNLHPLIFFDSRDADQMARVKKAGWEIMEACVALGGTISGEHGIGLEKVEAMRLVFSEDDFEAQRSLKRAFDAGDRLNPGKVIPASDP